MTRLSYTDPTAYHEGCEAARELADNDWAILPPPSGTSSCLWDAGSSANEARKPLVTDTTTGACSVTSYHA